jgi:hypothetical protein
MDPPFLPAACTGLAVNADASASAATIAKANFFIFVSFAYRHHFHSPALGGRGPSELRSG